ncbi:MAG: hypothetical protein ACJ76I_12030 [Gaiellaceae bacterium]
MARQPNEPLSELELLALALADARACDSDVAEAIPQRVWDELDDRNLIATSRDWNTDSTEEGAIALHEWIEYLAGPKVVV